MKQKNLVLMGIAVGCGLVAAILTAKMSTPAPVETVKVLSASRDLTTGTAFTKANIDELTTVNDVPKASIPPEAKLVLNKEELIGKRLSRATHAGEYFNVADVNSKTTILFEPNRDIMSLPMTAAKAASGFVGPGSRVDIVGSVIEGKARKVFTLLPDMHVLAVNGIQDLLDKQTFPDMSMVSFSVTEDEAKLIALANQRQCNLELLLRHPDAPLRFPTPELRETARKATLNLLANLGENTTELPDGDKGTPKESKKEEVEVYVATEDIPAGTAITTDVVETKLTKVKKLKENVDGACLDLKPHTGHPAFEAFKFGITKGSYVTQAMIGKAEIEKPAPQDTAIESKPMPDPTKPPVEVAVAPMPHLYIEPLPPAPRFRDVALHSPQGTIVHRYQETGIDTNEWRLIAILTPYEAAGRPPTKTATPTDPKKTDPKTPVDSKID